MIVRMISFGSKDKYVRMIMEYPEVDEKYYEEDMMNNLEISDDGGICDGYCHHHDCTHLLIEGKSKRHISKAISQLKNTAQQLISKGKKIDRAIIICEKISRNERRLYFRDKKNKLCKNYGNIAPVYLLGKIEILLIFKKEMSVVGVSCLFG